jgi:acyl-CoA thioester hydrolase
VTAQAIDAAAPPPGRPKAEPAPGPGNDRAPTRSWGSDPNSGAAWGQTFQWPVRVYWEDTDAGGIVFYANYLKFFERARTEWLRQLGLGQQALREQTGGMFVVSDCTLRYRQSARLDDLLLVTASPVEIGKASLTIAQSALLKPQQAGEPSALLCEGSIRIGWVDAATLRPQRIPAAVLRMLQAGGAAPAPTN